MKSQRAFLAACGGATMIIATALLPSWSSVGADGTETLGPPSVAIAEGSGVVVSGVGLELSQPGTINIDVPVGATVEQVLLYWEGQSTTDIGGDETVDVNGTSVTGTLIGGPTLFFPNAYGSTYRADITALGAVVAGPNAVAVGGLTFDRVNNGAGLVVIYDDGTTADIGIVDGNDLMRTVALGAGGGRTVAIVGQLAMHTHGVLRRAGSVAASTPVDDVEAVLGHALV